MQCSLFTKHLLCRDSMLNILYIYMHTHTHTIYIYILFNPFKNAVRIVLLYAFYTWGKLRLRQFNLFWVTLLVNNRVRIQLNSVSFPCLCC